MPNSPDGLRHPRRATRLLLRSALCLCLAAAPACAVYDPALIGSELEGGAGNNTSGGLAEHAGATNPSAGKGSASGGASSGGADNANEHAGAPASAGSNNAGSNNAGSNNAGSTSGGAGNAAGANSGGATSAGGAPSAGAPAGGALSAGAPAGGAPSAGAPAGGAPAAGAGGADPCDKMNWKATASSSSLNTDPPQLYNPPVQAIDGNASSRWSTGVEQAGVEWFLLNLGSKASHLTQLVLDTTNSPSDFPVTYQVELSADGKAYNQVASGAGATVTTIDFADTPAQYVRIKQTGTGASWWSIHELSLTCKK